MTKTDYIITGAVIHQAVNFAGSVCPENGGSLLPFFPVRKDITENSDIEIIVDFNKSIGIEFMDLAICVDSKRSKKIDLVS